MTVVKVPQERIGVLVGKNGEVKNNIENVTGTSINIESESGEVYVEQGHSDDPAVSLKAIEIIKAIARGFSPERALILLKDEYYLAILNIKDYAGNNKRRIRQLRGRVIGKDGRTRELIEELSDTKVSVYGNTVAVIGEYEELEIAKIAIDMILNGAEHSSVYSFLERKRKELYAKKQMEMWG